MHDDPDLNPYSPPAAASGAAAPSEGTGPLKDPRLLGRLATFSAGALFVVRLLIHVFPNAEVVELLEKIQTVSSVTTMVLYLWWLARCAKNTAVIDRRNQTGPVWAVFCHFVPVANWFSPCLVLRRIAITTFKHRAAAGIGYIVIAWWFLLVSAIILEGIEPQAGEPIMSAAYLAPWGSLGAQALAFACFAYLLARIGSAQAAFRWPDLPESDRPGFVRWSGPRSAPRMLPNAKVTRIPPRREPASQPRRLAPPPRTQPGDVNEA
ncbi:DUF4328 domain-containing protein [Luteolibacter sp. GHJ8]|uniref:DUF4328 domain-containing protein n=2 Tax=Luteolibacter rhizosphaerae TaxID=2989719 RepID=A0ABT3FYD3_9BACT|nr:DUF4328 domain-containing protein [Luteolibacter rhizosphaerae]